MPSKLIGQILIENAGLTPAALEQAIETQRQEGGRLGEVLIKARAMTEDDVLKLHGWCPYA